MRWLIRTLFASVALLAVAALAAHFTLRRPDIPFATLEARYADASSHYLDLSDGVRIHYREWGLRDGPVLVLLHGFGASTEAWRPWASLLGDRYRIIAIDLPGHGLTRTPAHYRASTTAYVAIVESVAARLGLTRFAIAGNSMGGGVAWNYALSYPARLDALVLVNAAGWRPPGPRHDGPLLFSLIGAPVIGPALREWDTTILTRATLQDAFENDVLVTEEMVTRYTSLARAPGHRAILSSIAQDGAAIEHMPRIATPTLILHGESDRLIPVDAARAYAARIPGSELIIYPAMGHLPMEEIPARSAASVSEFLARIAARNASSLQQETPGAPASPSRSQP